MSTTTTPKSRPILFSGPMVRAILEGKKTQTRRILTDQSIITTHADGSPAKTSPRWSITGHYGRIVSPHPNKGKFGAFIRRASVLPGSTETDIIPCPYGGPEDQLWVREEHYRFGHWEPVPGVRTKKGRQKWMFMPEYHPHSRTHLFHPPSVFRKGRHHKDPGTPAWHKRIARFMPRDFSRITLEIESIRVERLNDISDQDSISEGIERGGQSGGWKDYSGAGGIFGPAVSYASLWESINGPGSWAANPWVWVISFRKL